MYTGSWKVVGHRGQSRIWKESDSELNTSYQETHKS